MLSILDLALCGQKWTTDAEQPEARKSSEEQKEKAPQKGALDPVFSNNKFNDFKYLVEGDPGIEPGTFGSGDQRSIH